MSAFERLFSAQGAVAASRAAPQATSSSAALVVVAALCSLLAATALSTFLTGLANFLRVRRGLQGIPRAPGGSRLLGHVLPLMQGTPWDVMEDWVRETSAFARRGGGSGAEGAGAGAGEGKASLASAASAVPPAASSLGPPCPDGMCVATVGHRKLLVVGSARAAREIFQTKARRFSKDLDFSFKPFLPILGTGLVTASGGLWQSQRLLIAPALRVDILEAVPRIAVAAAERLARKLEAALAAAAAAGGEEGEAAAAAAALAAAAAASAGDEGGAPKGSGARGDVSPASVMLSPASRAGSAASLAGSAAAAAAAAAAPPPPLSSLADAEAVVDMEEEFRLLTLQIIGEAVLSLPPAECDRVFPELYLPVMEEANLRALRPWRALVPGEARRKYARGIRALDAYIRALLRERWAERKARSEARAAAAAAAAAAGKVDDDDASPPPPPAEERDDILETMLAAIEHRGEGWSHALETQLCFEVKTFLLAGHETSAAMLTWSLYELGRGDARLPESAKVAAGAAAGAAGEDCCFAVRDAGAAAALARVRKEAESVLKLSSSPLKSSSAPVIPSREAAEDGFDFSLACLKESLRKYSVVPVVTRVAAQDTELCGRKVPKGTYVAICIQAVHNNTVEAAGGWKSPGSWEPERFLPGGEAETMPDSAPVEKKASASSSGHGGEGEEGGEEGEGELLQGLRAFNYLPFIQGPRNCLGQYFALLEARIVLARLVARFDFVKATPGGARRHPAVIPTGPEGGMPMRVRLRK